MRNILLVIRHEILTMLAKPSFWLMTFIFPVAVMGLSVLPRLAAAESQVSTVQRALVEGLTAPMGTVDLAGALRELPPDVPPSALRTYPDEAAAGAALAAGEIVGYYLVGPEYTAGGKVIAVSTRGGTLAVVSQEQVLRYVLSFNLTGDAARARLLVNPMAQVEAIARSPEVRPGAGSSLQFGVVFGVMLVLFFIITVSAGYMLQSVTKEKESRTVEVLLTSVRPREVMLGKVVGLGALGLVQMLVWMGGGLAVLGGGLALLGISAPHLLRLSFVALAAVYFLLGYTLYASMLGAVGALAPTTREGAQFTFALMLPLILPFWLNQTFTASPNGPLATFFSLFPMSAPTSMLARLAVANVPAWQVAASLAGLLAATYGFVLLSARFFRADTLLSHETLTWARIGRELRR